MAIEDLRPIEALQWAPSGNGLDGKPGEVLIFLASNDGTTHGYGYGQGNSIDFGSEQGPINVKPAQWIVRLVNENLSMELIVVEDERPEEARVFDPVQRREEFDLLKWMESTAKDLGMFSS